MENIFINSFLKKNSLMVIPLLHLYDKHKFFYSKYVFSERKQNNTYTGIINVWQEGFSFSKYNRIWGFTNFDKILVEKTTLFYEIYLFFFYNLE